MTTRLAIAASLTVIITPTVQGSPWPQAMSTLVVDVASEMIVGLLVGLFLALVFGVIQLGMEIGSQQIGYGAALQFDPMTKVQTTPMTTLVAMLCGALFLGLDLHLLVIGGVVQSLHSVPPGALLDPIAPARILIQTTETVLRSGLSLAAPLITFALLVQASLAMVMRITPSMNVFFSVGYIVLLVFGTALLAVELPNTLAAGMAAIEDGARNIPELIELAR